MKKTLFLCGLLVLALALPVWAAMPITTLFNTGLNADGLLVPSGPDAHYKITAVAQAFSTDASGFPVIQQLNSFYAVALPRTPVIVQNPYPGAWVPNGPNSNWIGPTSVGIPYQDGAGLDDNGNYIDRGIWIYQTTFDLTGLDPKTVHIAGIWGTDDPGWMFLNLDNPNVPDASHLVVSGGGFSSLPPFEISGANGLFRPGLNTLTFVVWDAGDVVTGLRMDIQSATAERAVRIVPIDIKPGSFPNSVNLSSEGTLPVAILSLPDFDARTVDVSTVTLSNAAVVLKKNGTYMASVEDVNGDGLLDLVIHVSTENLVIDTLGGEAVLKGKTVDGTNIEGRDFIRVVP
jgi:hypothetical protein